MTSLEILEALSEEVGLLSRFAMEEGWVRSVLGSVVLFQVRFLI